MEMVPKGVASNFLTFEKHYIEFDMNDFFECSTRFRLIEFISIQCLLSVHIQ